MASTDTITKPEDLFLQSLRSSTAQLHTQLEQTPLSIALLKPPLEAETYASYLMAMKEVILFCETSLFPLVSKVIKDIEERRKLSGIQADLDALANFVPASGYTAFKPLSSPIDEATALGYLYVIEGSTLGGRVILKQLENNSALQTTQAVQFFSGYGANTGRMWKSFLEALSAYAVHSNQQSSIIEGANHAFQSIHDYFLSLRK